METAIRQWLKFMYELKLVLCARRHEAEEGRTCLLLYSVCRVGGNHLPDQFSFENQYSTTESFANYQTYIQNAIQAHGPPHRPCERSCSGSPSSKCKEPLFLSYDLPLRAVDKLLTKEKGEQAHAGHL